MQYPSFVPLATTTTHFFEEETKNLQQALTTIGEFLKDDVFIILGKDENIPNNFYLLSEKMIDVKRDLDFFLFTHKKQSIMVDDIFKSLCDTYENIYDKKPDLSTEQEKNLRETCEYLVKADWALGAADFPEEVAQYEITATNIQTFLVNKKPSSKTGMTLKK